MKKFRPEFPQQLEHFDALCRTSNFTRFVLVLGLAVCLLAAALGKNLCTDGSCFVYASETAYGGLLYYLGAVMFGLLLAVQIKKPRLFTLASLAALGADIPFLVMQTAFLPCTICLLITTCLVVNALFAIEPWIEHKRDTMAFRGAMMLLMVSGMMLGHNMLVLGKTTIQGQSLNAAPETNTRLYFAPTNQKQLAQVLTMYHAVQGRVQLLPVGESFEDTYTALLIKGKLAEGQPVEVALQASQRESAQAAQEKRISIFSGPEGTSLFQVFKMRLALLQNATLLENTGGKGLPSLQVGNGPLCWGNPAPLPPIIPFKN